MLISCIPVSCFLLLLPSNCSFSLCFASVFLLHFLLFLWSFCILYLFLSWLLRCFLHLIVSLFMPLVCCSFFFLTSLFISALYSYFLHKTAFRCLNKMLTLPHQMKMNPKVNIACNQSNNSSTRTGRRDNAACAAAYSARTMLSGMTAL